MAAKPAIGLAIIIQIPATQHPGFLQNDVLDHAAMALGHQKSVGRRTIQTATHEPVVHAIDDLGARIRGANVERAHLLRNVEDATSVTQAAFLCSLAIERVASNHFVHSAPTRLHLDGRKNIARTLGMESYRGPLPRSS